MELNLLGRYWKENECWIAEVACMKLQVSAVTPYMSILKLLEKLDGKCSISVVDNGVFYVHSNDVYISSLGDLVRKT